MLKWNWASLRQLTCIYRDAMAKVTARIDCDSEGSFKSALPKAPMFYLGKRHNKATKSGNKYVKLG